MMSLCMLCMCIAYAQFIAIICTFSHTYINVHDTGVMPEVKRREIQRRQQRRERLWRGDTNNNGDGTDGAIKRAAKKILVKQLKEMREKQGRLKKNKKTSMNGGVNGNDGMLMREEEENAAKSSSNDGALAAGFILDNNEDENTTSTSTKQQSSPVKYKTAEQEDEVISINSKDDSSIMDQVAMIDQAVAIQSYKQQQKKNEDENDWEMSMAVQESINDSLQQQHPTNSSPTNHTNEAETTTYDTINAKTGHHHTTTSSNQYNPAHNNNSITNEQIASFNMHQRHEWIEYQKRQQRITSRKECILSAANPQDYSNTQLKNFLKSSMLSKRVSEIDKLVKDRESNGVEEGSGGDMVAEEEAYSGGGGFATSSGGIPTTRPLQRLKRQKNDTQSDHNDEDDELFTSSATNHDTSTANGKKTQAATASGSKTKAATMQALFGKDDIEEEGGGFFLPSSASDEPTKQAASSNVTASFAKMDSRENELVLLDDDDASVNSVEVVAKDMNILENGKDNTYEKNHTAQATQNSTAALPPSKLLELSTAEEEWEKWGGGEEDDDVNEALQNKSTAPSRVNTNMAMDASDSDSDDGQDNTFLTLGQATKRVCTTDAKQPAAAVPNESILPTKEETEDEDEVDWEDGHSDGSDHSEEDPSVDDAVDQTEAAGVTSDIDYQVHTETALNGQEDNLKHKSSSSTNMDIVKKSNDKKNDIIELPSGDEEEPEAPPPMKQAPSNNKKKGEEEPLVIDSSDDDNEFDTYRPDDPQAAALLRAQDTASRLTSWAGRAFRRAINDHATEQSHVDSPPHSANKEQSVKEHIDLTANDDDEVIDVDENDTNADESTDGKLPAQSHTTTETTTVNNDSSTEKQQQSNNNQQVLFDTSLEGLTEAHNAILEEDRTMERDLSTMTDEMKEDILKLLQLCGIPWVESPSEAEAQCAALEELGLVDGVVTEDSDIFIFGAKKVYKNFFNENKYCEAYYAKDIQKDLGLGKHQLVALAMLLGGDYTDGVKGVGIVNGMEILQAFAVDDSAEGIKNGLQRLREWLDGFGEPLSSSSQKEVVFHNKHKSARTRWIAPADFPSHGIIKAYLQPVVDKSEATFSWGKPDLTSLQQYCAEVLGWDQAETDRVVQPVLKVIEAGSKQTRLESYFMRYEDKQLAGKVKSKRLQAVLQDIQGNDNEDEFVGNDKNDMEMEEEDIETPNDNDESKLKKKRQKR